MGNRRHTAAGTDAGHHADVEAIRRALVCVCFVMAGLVPAIHVFAREPKGDVDARDKRGHDGSSHTTIITGFSISPLNAPISSAPSAPSTARWSQESVTLITCAATIWPLRTIARSSAAPAARMVACGGLITAVKSLMPYMPRFETAVVPP